MGRHAGAGIAGIEADELQPHRLPRHRRHDAEIALVLLDRQHLADRLQDAALREFGQRHLHRRDQRLPRQQPGDPLLVEKHHHVRPPSRRENYQRDGAAVRKTLIAGRCHAARSAGRRKGAEIGCRRDRALGGRRLVQQNGDAGNPERQQCHGMQNPIRHFRYPQDLNFSWGEPMLLSVKDRLTSRKIRYNRRGKPLTSA